MLANYPAVVCLFISLVVNKQLSVDSVVEKVVNMQFGVR